MADVGIEIEVGAGPRVGEYAARVVKSASGAAPHGTLSLDVDAVLRRRDVVERAVLASGEIRPEPRDIQPDRVLGGDLVPDSARLLQDVGQELFDGLFSGAIRGVYRDSKGVARERGSRLRLTLYLTAPELAILPWEAMWDPEENVYICLKAPLVRRLQSPVPEPLWVDPALRILGLVASPRNLATLDVDAEKRHLAAALAARVADGRVVLEWLPDASWHRLHEALLNDQWHVLHFIGHGSYDPHLDRATLALVGEDGRAEWVQAERLADLLDQAEPSPRLVVLNSCSSGTSGTRELMSGTAAALVHSGISAVTAMQFSVSDHAAKSFPRGFYMALAAGRGLDDAVLNGRLSMSQGDSLEWVTPVLYARGMNIFYLPPNDIKDPLLRSAVEAVRAERWEEAIRLFSRLLNKDPEDPRYRAGLAHARGKQLAKLDTLATKAEEEKRWCDAVKVYQSMTEIDPNYRDAIDRLAKAQSECGRPRPPEPPPWRGILLVTLGGLILGIVPFLPFTQLAGGWYAYMPWQFADGPFGYLALALPILAIVFGGLTCALPSSRSISLGVICGATLLNLVIFAEITIGVLSNAGTAFRIGSWVHLTGTLLTMSGIMLLLRQSRAANLAPELKRDAWAVSGMVLVVSGLVGALIGAAAFQDLPSERWVWAYPVVLALVAVPATLLRLDTSRRSTAVTTVITYVVLGSIVVVARFVGLYLNLDLTATYCWTVVLSGATVMAGCIISQAPIDSSDPHPTHT